MENVVEDSIIIIWMQQFACVLGWSDFYFFIGQNTALTKGQVWFRRTPAHVQCALKFSFSKNARGPKKLLFFVWKSAWSFLLH